MKVKPWVTKTAAGEYFNKSNYKCCVSAPGPNLSGFEQPKKKNDGSQPMPKEEIDQPPIWYSSLLLELYLAAQ